MTIVSPEVEAGRYRAEIKTEMQGLDRPLKVVGILSGDYAPSKTYAAYTKSACEELGVIYELREVGGLSLEKAIREANDDPAVHGIMVYYPR